MGNLRSARTTTADEPLSATDLAADPALLPSAGWKTGGPGRDGRTIAPPLIPTSALDGDIAVVAEAKAQKQPADWAFVSYLLAVIIPGLAVFVAVIVRDVRQFTGHPALIALMAPVVLLGEMFPIQIIHHGEKEEVTISTTFAVALLILAGLGPAIAAMAVASMASDLVRHRPVHRAVFNVAQYTFSLAATAAVVNALAPTLIGRGHLVTGDIVAIAVGAAAYFAVNNTLPAIAIAMSRELPVGRFLVQDIALQATIAGLALAMVPLVVAVTGTPWIFSPFLLVPVLMVYRSATSRARLAFEASHDGLTGLANRAELSRRMVKLIESWKPDEQTGAVVLVDLDRFKEVNEVLGHAAGDELLRRIADRLRVTVARPDLIARFEGDEFALLCETASAQEASRIGQLVLGALGEPVAVGEATINVDASVGIAVMTDGVTVPDELLRRADIALHQAKRAHSGYQLYDRRRDPGATSGLTLLQEVHAALHDGQFVLHYQPKAATKSGHILGAEALARWEHPLHGLLGPAAFIPLIEQSGLAREFTCFAIEQALGQAQVWHQDGLWMPVAVNLTVRNVHDSRFPDDVAAALERGGGNPGLLQLEVTEGIMMADPARVLAVLEALAAQGIKLSLDDYGTGYSSLSYLGQLPLDELKIDKSFIMGMATQKHHVAIIRSTIELAHNLGLKCVAEGVEDAWTWDQLENLGCDVIQGFFLSKPRPASELSSWLAETASRRPRSQRPRQDRAHPLTEIDIRD